MHIGLICRHICIHAHFGYMGSPPNKKSFRLPPPYKSRGHGAPPPHPTSHALLLPVFPIPLPVRASVFIIWTDAVLFGFTRF